VALQVIFQFRQPDLHRRAASLGVGRDILGEGGWHGGGFTDAGFHVVGLQFLIIGLEDLPPFFPELSFEAPVVNLGGNRVTAMDFPRVSVVVVESNRARARFQSIFTQ
jgi:hypothetical protein